mmetsp:Transcript_67030/g.196014  ORF Transcript_67030/g.196014 Transcript_67030/m.196014 type:complete len:221 (-) Transcript_67030:203-865(-)
MDHKVLNTHNKELLIVSILLQYGCPYCRPELQTTCTTIFDGTVAKDNVTKMVELSLIVGCAQIPRVTRHGQHILLPMKRHVHDWQHVYVLGVLETPLDICWQRLSTQATVPHGTLQRLVGPEELSLDNVQEVFARHVTPCRGNLPFGCLQQFRDVGMGLLSQQIVARVIDYVAHGKPECMHDLLDAASTAVSKAHDDNVRGQHASVSSAHLCTVRPMPAV